MGCKLEKHEKIVTTSQKNGILFRKEKQLYAQTAERG